MSDRIKKAFDMLKWALGNKKNIIETTKHFKVSERYLREVKKSCKKQEGYKEFIDLYTKVKGGAISAVDNEKHESDIEDEQQKFTEESNGSATYEYKGEKMLTSLQEAIKFFKIDTKIWEVERWICNSYPVSARKREQDLTWEKNADGQQIMQGYSKRHDEWTTRVNYQIKIWLKKAVEREAALSFEDFYKDLLSKHKPFQHKPVVYKKKKENNLLEISVYDAHIGKLCWSEENRGEDYDIKIASKRFNEAIQGSIQRVSGSDFEKILFVVGNDFFNSDTITNTTTAGTIQDEDTRWKKTFNLGFKLLVGAIDYMRQHAPVDVVVIPGNHDETRSFFVGHSLASWYKNDKCVNIDNSAPTRKYYRYGKNLLGLTHGNEEKEDRLPQLMAHEAKKDWAETEFHEWHLGHLHKKHANKYKVPIYDEDLGVVIRRLSSIAGTDKWHFTKSYVGTQRAAEAFLWNIDGGLYAHFNINVKF
jgi:hypothetical protein